MHLYAQKTLNKQFLKNYQNMQKKNPQSYELSKF